MIGIKAPVLTIVHTKNNRIIWYTIGLITIVNLLWMQASNIAFNNSQFIALASISILLIIGVFYRYVRDDEHIFLFSQLGLQLVLSSGTLALFSYLSARLNYPYVDAQLVDLDHVLFFDWREWVEFVAQNPSISQLLSITYQTVPPQMIVLLFVLFLSGKLIRLQQFLMTFMVSGFLTCLLAALFPAVGGYIYYSVDITQWAQFSPAAPYKHLEHLTALRDHSMTMLPDKFEGIITFPSFHCALAALLIYASWPIKWLRLVMVPLNLLMIVSSIADGGHYLTDILAGICMALLAIKISGFFIKNA